MDKTPKLTIRLASTMEDFEQWVATFEACHQESRYAHYPFSADKIRRSASNVLDNSDFFGWLLAEYGEQQVGFIYCSIGELHFAKDLLSTTVVNFYIAPQFKKSPLGGKAAIALIRALQKWSKLRGAHEIFVHDTSGIDTQGSMRFFQRMGFKFIGGNFSAQLK